MTRQLESQDNISHSLPFLHHLYLASNKLAQIYATLSFLSADQT